VNQFTLKISRVKYRFFSIFEGIATAHDHDHFLALSLCDQIVHDKVRLPLPDPSGLVLSYAMLQVQYRISFISFFISIRCIDITFLQVAAHLRSVFTDADRTMRNILCKIEIHILLLHLKSIDRSKTPIRNSGVRIADPDTVHIPEIIMHPPVKILNFRKKSALPIGHQIYFLICKISPKSGNLYYFCCRCIQIKNDCAVFFHCNRWSSCSLFFYWISVQSSVSLLVHKKIPPILFFSLKELRGIFLFVFYTFL